ncbi:MAG: hypothetical protein U5Q44_08150 [Dehalococcoidia bacterium]|nr:hypothetical protein [Dehalococcoidia bacterium]
MDSVDILLSPTRGTTAMSFQQANEDYMAMPSFTGSSTSPDSPRFP